jgi:hypothetical protein
MLSNEIRTSVEARSEASEVYHRDAGKFLAAILKDVIGISAGVHVVAKETLRWPTGNGVRVIDWRRRL